MAMAPMETVIGETVFNSAFNTAFNSVFSTAFNTVFDVR